MVNCWYMVKTRKNSPLLSKDSHADYERDVCNQRNTTQHSTSVSPRPRIYRAIGVRYRLKSIDEMLNTAHHIQSVGRRVLLSQLLLVQHRHLVVGFSEWVKTKQSTTKGIR